MHVHLSNHFILIFLLLDDVSIGHPDVVVVVDSELMLRVLQKSGPSSNISHLRLSVSPLIILLLSVLVVRRSFQQERSTTYKKNFYDSAAHLFMFRPCSTFLSHKHALDWKQFKVVL